jgi:hypothetical protein
MTRALAAAAKAAPTTPRQARGEKRWRKTKGVGREVSRSRAAFQGHRTPRCAEETRLTTFLCDAVCDLACVGGVRLNLERPVWGQGATGHAARRTFLDFLLSEPAKALSIAHPDEEEVKKNEGPHIVAFDLALGSLDDPFLYVGLEADLIYAEHTSRSNDRPFQSGETQPGANDTTRDCKTVCRCENVTRCEAWGAQILVSAFWQNSGHDNMCHVATLQTTSDIGSLSGRKLLVAKSF